MFVGSMTLAYAMEHVRLHRRLALLVLRYVGSSVIWCVLFFFFFIPNEYFYVLNRSMAGLMGVTAFLSMWINNSAAANIMIPAAIAVVNELQNYHQTTTQTSVTNENDNHQNATGSAPIDFTSKEHLYLNIQITNQHFLFAAVLENSACSDEQPVEHSTVLENILVASNVLPTE